MKFIKIFESFLKKTKIEKKAQTLQCYDSHIRSIMKCLENLHISDTEEVGKDFYLDFVEYYKNNNCCNRTINKRMTIFKSACKYNDIEYDFFKNQKLKETFKRFHTIEEEELKLLINYIHKMDHNDIITLNDKVVLLLLLDTGVRSNELINIEIKNVNLDNNSILLTITKTDSQRLVFFNKYTAEFVKMLYELNSDKKYLLYNFRKDTEYTYRCLTCLLDKIKKELKIDLLHPHMFRHTFATNLIDREAPIVMVQLLLGHSSVRTTQNYIHLSENRLKKCYDDYANYY